MNVTNTIFSMAILSTGLAFSGMSQATLVDRMNGMWYDPVLDVTWLDSTVTGQTWNEAVDWASNLNHAGFEGWRLPTVNPINGTDFQLGFAADGSTDDGWNITSPNSELAHLFNVTLGNSAIFDNGFLSGDSVLSNRGPFQNLLAGAYWTGTEFFLDTDDFAWAFLTDFGLQTDDLKSNQNFAIAVRDGDVAATQIPVPATMWLSIGGLVGLVGMRRRKAIA